MKHLAALAFLVPVVPALATDRIVEEFGQPPAYASINAAVAASVDGDRIIIKNRAGNIPWIENITVDRSLQFLSFTNDDFFYVQGTYTIAAAPGREVSIVSMRNTSGGIVGSGSGNARSTKVRVLDSYFVSGSIDLDIAVFEAEIVGNTVLGGGVTLNFGNVVGNDIDASATSGVVGIQVATTATGTTLDTCAIIGNKVKTSGYGEGIFTSTNQQVVHIRNNYVQHAWMGIQCYGGNTSAVQNLIWNNTVTAHAGQFSVYGIDMANTNANSVWEIMNNVVTTTWNGDNRGINKDSGNSGQINVYYNHVASGMTYPISPDFTFLSNNTTNQSITLNADGSLNNAPACVDGGNPATVLSDLDLSIGDAGAFGGSYTHTNYFPLHNGAARVYLTGHPFNVRTGSTLRVKGNAFDR